MKKGQFQCLNFETGIRKYYKANHLEWTLEVCIIYGDPCNLFGEKINYDSLRIIDLMGSIIKKPDFKDKTKLYYKDFEECYPSYEIRGRDDIIKFLSLEKTIKQLMEEFWKP